MLVLTAPAKLNFFLHVTGRRPDGYHLLESVFVPVSLADTVELVTTRADEAPGITLCGAPPGLTAENELGCRAARALAAYAGIRAGARIRLIKRIPSGAGLGGGSSDAAAVLIGLNRLWGLGLSRRELARLALPLGADIPFFLGEGPAFVTGIGETVRPVTLPARDVVIAHPGVAAETAAVFRSPRVVRDTAPIVHFGWPIDWGGNDLETAAREIAPEITAL
ncbi:MAG: 4-(cytidine 5'-diphospho)-2-C-methyl-D-erythritol kinase, partial [Casimicrobiaceae bacterium]